MTAIRKTDNRFVETEVDGELVLMNTDSGTFYSLDGTGLAIWRAIDGTRNRDTIVSTLAADFDAPVETIAPDVDAFLSTLREAGLLEKPIAS